LNHCCSPLHIRAEERLFGQNNWTRFKKLPFAEFCVRTVTEKEPGPSQFFLVPVFVLLTGLVVGRYRQETRGRKHLRYMTIRPSGLAS
jgi:hypothetical protein